MNVRFSIPTKEDVNQGRGALPRAPHDLFNVLGLEGDVMVMFVFICQVSEDGCDFVDAALGDQPAGGKVSKIEQ